MPAEASRSDLELARINNGIVIITDPGSAGLGPQQRTRGQFVPPGAPPCR